MAKGSAERVVNGGEWCVSRAEFFALLVRMLQVSEEDRRRFEEEFNQYYKDLERAKEE